MKITPRHLAAAQYTVTAAICVASWGMLVLPVEGAVMQLRTIFAPGYELRQFFIWFAASTLLTIAVASAYWFKRSEVRPFTSLLLAASVLLFALALWLFDFALILVYGSGLFCAAWVWLRHHFSLKE